MTPLFERLDQEEAVVRDELDALREKVAATEKRLAHLTITRETLLSLGAEEFVNQDDGTQWPPEGPAAEPMPNGPAPDPQPADAKVPAGGPASVGPLEWEVARERMLVLLAGAGRAMKVQDICVAIGEDITNARRVETTRSRLKRLAKEGRVAEGPTAYFAIVPTDSGHRKEGAGMR